MGGLEETRAAADTSRVSARLREQGGFGLVELLVAMTMLNVGLLAIVAAFSSSSVAVRRASRISTAATMADQQMEVYRGLTWSTIALDTTSVGSTDSTYRCDVTLGTSCPNATTGLVTAGSPTCTSSLGNCLPSQSKIGPDNVTYRVDTYITLTSTASGRSTKQVTVVVRDPLSLTTTYVRESSTFDQAT